MIPSRIRAVRQHEHFSPSHYATSIPKLPCILVFTNIHILTVILCCSIIIKQFCPAFLLFTIIIDLKQDTIVKSSYLE